MGFNLYRNGYCSMWCYEQDFPPKIKVVKIQNPNIIKQCRYKLCTRYITFKKDEKDYHKRNYCSYCSLNNILHYCKSCKKIVKRKKNNNGKLRSYFPLYCDKCSYK